MKKLTSDSIRVSYSMLKAFEGGNVKGAVSMLLGLPTYSSASMATGDMLHQKWAQHIRATETLPEEFGASKLGSVDLVEKKLEAKLLGGKVVLSGVPDCVVSPAVIEFKTGGRATKAEDYANSRQHGVYQLLLTASDIHINRCDIYHYNTLTDEATHALVWLTKDTLGDTYSWVMAQTKSLLEYLKENQEAVAQIVKQSN